MEEQVGVQLRVQFRVQVHLRVQFMVLLMHQKSLRYYGSKKRRHGSRQQRLLRYLFGSACCSGRSSLSWQRKVGLSAL